MLDRTPEPSVLASGDLEAFERARVKSIAARRLFGGDAADPLALGQYEDLELVAEGGMGRVYRAHDTRLQRTVALKLVRPDRSDAFDAGVLLAEARAAAAVSHPNVIDIYEVGESGGLVYIAMRFVEGPSLEHWLGGNQASHAVLLEGLLAIASALAAAHREGVVHRDIKPHNILIADDGSFHLGDFGLAEAWQTSTPDSPDETSTRGFAGTPVFVAPELHCGDEATPASDLFSLGVTVFRSVYGEHPFEGTTLRWIVGGAEPPLCRRKGRFGRVPRSLRRAITTMLALDPRERPSAEQVEHTLRSLRAALSPRRQVALGLGLTLALVATVFALRPRSTPPDPCAEAGESVLAETQIAQLGEHLRTLELPFAATTAERAEAFFRRENDRAARGLAAECVLDSQRSLARTMLASDSCLEREIEVLRALHTALLELESDQLERVTPLLARLEGRGSCEIEQPQFAQLLGPLHAAKISDLRERLRRLDTLAELSPPAEAAGAARELLDEAQTLGDELSLAWAAVSTARTAARVGETEAAEAALETAFAASVQAGSPLWAARTLTLMVWVDASLREHPDSAARLANLGFAYTGKLGEREHAALLDVELLDHLSTALDLAGEYHRAESNSRRALATVLALERPNVVLEARVRANLAVVLSNLGRNDESLAESARAHAVLAREYGETHPHVVAVLNNLALQRFLANDLAGARQDFERALELKRALYGRAHPKLVSTRLGLAAVSESEGDIDGALVQLEEAGTIARRAFERGAGASSRQLENVWYERARVTLNAKRLEEAALAIERTLELERARAPTGRWVASDLLHLRILRARTDPRLASAIEQVRAQVDSEVLSASAWERLYLEFLGLSVALDPCRQADHPELLAFERRLAAEPDPGELADDVQAWLRCE